MPKYLFMIVNNTAKKESYLYIKLICKNKEFFNRKRQGEEEAATTTGENQNNAQNKKSDEKNQGIDKE